MNINLFLRSGRALAGFAGSLLLGVLFSFPAAAQNPAASPVPAVEEKPLPAPGNGLVVVELFSSQACAFCPKADQLFGDLLAQKNVIGLACHVDYFDVKEGSLSRPFCTERQSWYMERLAAGPNYTPQMVVNGTIDAVGYKLDDVAAALQKTSDIRPIQIQQGAEKGGYRVALPPEILQSPDAATNLQLWVFLYDRPHSLTIAGGANKGKKATYYNIVDKMDAVQPIAPEILLAPPLAQTHAGFAVLLQDAQSGKILGAGVYAAPETAPQNPPGSVEKQ